MKEILNGILVALLALFVFAPVNVMAQDDDEEPSCWCKNVQLHLESGLIAVWNVDSIAAGPGDPPLYTNVEGCEGKDCDTKECTFDVRVCNMVWVHVDSLTDKEREKFKPEELAELDSVKIKRCWPEPGGEGECTDETFMEDIPWDTTGMEPGDCNCIEIDPRGTRYGFYNNVTERIDDADPKYRWLPGGRCPDETCDESDCYFERYVKKKDKEGRNYWEWEQKTGFCTRYWPTEKGRGGSPKPETGGLDANTQSEFGFYPNPASTAITITGGTGVRTQIYDTSGKLLIDTNETYIDISELNKGMYYVVMSENDVANRKILVVAQ